jgi:carbamoyl-phosphate synthase large subunit
MAIVYDEDSFEDYVHEALDASDGRSVLIDKFLEGAIEVDVDCIADGKIQVLGSIMEHVEKAGIHSGDSACSIPARTLSEKVIDEIRTYTHALAKELNVMGLMNVQYAVVNEDVYIIEVNPRASRTIPFVSKAIGVPLARLAALVMAGKTLEELGFTKEVTVPHYAYKEAVLPFNRFPGCDAMLTPEMHSTGEVMGIDTDPGMAYIKSQLGAGSPLPLSGSVFLSVADYEKEAMIEPAKELQELGYKIYATLGTATILRENGVKAKGIFRISEGRPNVLDMITENDVQWIVNVPSGTKPAKDDISMRTEAIRRGVPITTTVRGLQATLSGLKRIKKLKSFAVLSLQEFNRKTENVNG